MNKNLEIEMTLYVIRNSCDYAIASMSGTIRYIDNMTQRTWLMKQVQRAKEILDSNFPKDANELLSDKEKFFDASIEINHIISKYDELFKDADLTDHDKDRYESISWCCDFIRYNAIYLTSLTPE